MRNLNHKIKFSFEETFDFFKHEIEKEIQSYNSISQTEYMTERKIEEMNQHFSFEDLSLINQLKNKFWRFNHLQDLNGCLEQLRNIKPCIIPGDENWVVFRRIISSAEYTGGLGRSIRLYVADKTTDKLLGLIEIKSDFKTLKSRDKFIGWDKTMKNKHKKLNNIGILSTLIPTPEFSFNVLGGKLIAFLGLSDEIRNTWKLKYNDILEGVTTSSLYGHKTNGSIYTGNKYFKSLNHSQGNVIYSLPNELFATLKYLISEEFPQNFDNLNKGTNPKQRLMDFILNVYKIDRKDCTHGYQRGLYFSEFYFETKDHLNNRNLNTYTPKFKYTVQEIFDEWLPKSLKRFEKLHQENKLKTNFITYENNIFNS
jgi:hypothetical protein